MRKVVTLQGAFVCKEHGCKLGNHECFKCMYNRVKESFENLESGYKVLTEGPEFDEVHGEDDLEIIQIASQDVGNARIDARIFMNNEFYGVTDEDRKKYKRLYNWDDVVYDREREKPRDKDEDGITVSDVSDMFELWLTTVGPSTLMERFKEKGGPISREKAEKLLRPFRKDVEDQP